jgi:hypothetical protein
MKRVLVFVSAIVASLALAASAGANVGSIEISCQGVTFSYTKFSSNVTTQSHEVVTVNGVTVFDDTFTFSGSPAQHVVPLNITANATVTASFQFASSNGHHGAGSDQAALSCGGSGTTTGGTSGGTTTGGTSGGTTTGGTSGGTTTGGTSGGTTTGGATTGGTTGGTTGTTGGATTGTGSGGVSPGTTGGTTGGTGGTTGTTGGTTGGTPSTPSGELPFTGLPMWIPLLAAAAIVASGIFLVRRRKGEVG